MGMNVERCIQFWQADHKWSELQKQGEDGKIILNEIQRRWFVKRQIRELQLSLGLCGFNSGQHHVVSCPCGSEPSAYFTASQSTSGHYDKQETPSWTWNLTPIIHFGGGSMTAWILMRKTKQNRPITFKNQVETIQSMLIKM